ncbi:MOLPALP family lipoprotein [[Acholeplasma] multilocale]|uniref:MOLPALP family lipoprotein n=1 Tax=[Acholeplasma] multilocale TaxID=264638 RepID=UPI00047AC6CD|nr:MOLPALP family lipoprotein [[Acholeplasma] multilocale]
MKKLLTILGAISITASSAAMVVACSDTAKADNDKMKFSNSQNNLEGSAASIAKQIIMADQNKYDLSSLNNYLGELNAFDTFKGMGIELDANDYNVESNSDLSMLNKNYFGEALNLSDTEIEGVDLSGSLGDGSGAIENIMGESILGIPSKQFSGMLKSVMVILPTLTTDILNSMIPGLSGNINLLDENTKEAMGKVIDFMSNNPEIKSTINKTIDEIDVIKYFEDRPAQELVDDGWEEVLKDTEAVKVGQIDSALLVSLINTIFAITKPGSEPIEFNTSNSLDPNVLTGKIMKLLMDLMQKPEADSTNIDLNDTENVLNISKHIIRTVTLLQYKISLFDETKDIIQPIDANHLFSNKKTNTEYMRDEFFGRNEEITSIFKKGGLNLEYIIGTLKYYLGSADKERDPKGYRIQKLINILLPIGEEFKGESFEGPENTNFLMFMISNFAPIIFSGMLSSQGVPDILGNLYITVEELLKTKLGMDLSDVVSSDDFTSVISSHIGTVLFDINHSLNTGEPITSINIMLEDLFKNDTTGIGKLAIGIIGNLPLIEDLFTFLYSGDLKSLIGMISKETVDSIDSIFGSNKPLNLITILDTPLDKMIGKEVPIGSHYTEMSVGQIIDQLAADLGVDEMIKLKDVEYSSIHFKDINLLVNKIFENTYTDAEGNKNTGNAISQILNKPQDIDIILGFINGKIIPDSIWEVLVNKFLKPINEKNGETIDNLSLYGKLISKIYNNLDKAKDYSEQFIKEFTDNSKFKFTFKDLNKFDKVAIKGQTLIVEYTNDKNEIDVYIFKYERSEKNGDFKMLEISKK